MQRAVELWTDAAELGSNQAHHELARSYYLGDGVGKDEAQAVEHWENAAMAGTAESRAGLGLVEYKIGNYRLATKHFLISTKMGCKHSLGMIRDLFMNGDATKAQCAEALEGYQDSVEMKSRDRELARTLPLNTV